MRPDLGTDRLEVWIDDRARTIQVDTPDGSWTLDYDDQDRLVHATTPVETRTWTYEADRVTYASTTGGSGAYDLDADGRAVHTETRSGPVDYSYDSAGHLTSMTWGERLWVYSYDGQGRVATACHDCQSPQAATTSYAYTETPGHLEIDLKGHYVTTYTYDFDDAGRVVRAAVGGSGFTYTYAGDRITAVGDDRYLNLETEFSGTCPGVTTAFGPSAPLPVRLNDMDVELPNPIVLEFNTQSY